MMTSGQISTWRYFLAGIISVFAFFFFQNKESLSELAPVVMAVSAIINFSLFYYLQRKKIA
ncbi:MAG TPA: hypothetical protein VFM59_00390 [Salinimicrobium sp.]|nr:hypothetical protein [Salinimicrobium sp.]